MPVLYILSWRETSESDHLLGHLLSLYRVSELYRYMRACTPQCAMIAAYYPPDMCALPLSMGGMARALATKVS